MAKVTNNKKMVYLLLPIVLILWGIIFYRIFSKPSFVLKTQTKSLQKIRKGTDNSLKDHFFLSLNYPDPFTKKSYSSQTNLTNQENQTKNKKEANKWPQISYHGFVNQQNKALAYLVIDGKIFLAATHQKCEETEIIKIKADSVFLCYNKQRKWFKK